MADEEVKNPNKGVNPDGAEINDEKRADGSKAKRVSHSSLPPKKRMAKEIMAAEKGGESGSKAVKDDDHKKST